MPRPIAGGTALTNHGWGRKQTSASRWLGGIRAATFVGMLSARCRNPACELAWWTGGVDPEAASARHLLLAFDSSASLRARALDSAAGAAMEGGGAFHLLPGDGGFEAAGDVLRVWVRPQLCGGPLARALEHRRGRVTVATMPLPPTLPSTLVCVPAPASQPRAEIERKLASSSVLPLIVGPATAPGPPWRTVCAIWA